jgi:predicted RNA-binding protein with PUA-like domain
MCAAPPTPRRCGETMHSPLIVHRVKLLTVHRQISPREGTAEGSTRRACQHFKHSFPRDNHNVTDGGGGAGGEPTRFLLDTNATLVRLAMKQGHHIFVHPASRDELVGGSDPARGVQRLAELGKFQMLEESPITAYLSSELGPVVPDSNDHRDLRILASLFANAANFLVSNDAGLRRRARRVGVGDRVLTVADAAAMLEGFEPTVAPPPPRVRAVQSYALELDQEIFNSIRDDCPEFNSWIAKVQSDSPNRECYVVEEEDGTYAAIAILKIGEIDCNYGFAAPTTKISTFKVGQQFSGNHYGELLLKAVLQSHHDHEAESAYVEVWDRHERLIDFLAQFGYIDGGKSDRGENVLVKAYQPRDATLEPLEYHVSYGPPAVSGDCSVFVIPIREGWHNQLFPECDPDADSDQMALPGVAGPSTRPWGNALRKAYLCNASTNQMQPGDAILFYRSGFQTVSVVGITEITRRTSSPQEVLNLVGGRTVYSASDIEQMAQHSSQILVILFRQDRIIDPEWTLAELQAHQVLTAPPRTVTKVKEVGTQWVHQQLADT